MKTPRSIVTADCGHSEPTAKCVAFFVEQSSANHTIRFAEQPCLNGRGLAGRIRPSVASNQRRQSEERRASRSIRVYGRRSELLWNAVNGGVA